MTTAVIEISDLAPLDRTTAIELGRVEYRRFVDALGDLTPADWQAPTDCTEWTVRDLAGHVAGMMWSMSAFRRVAIEQARSARRGKREGIDPVDAMTAIQVERSADRTPDELVTEMNELVDTAASGRARMPGWFCRRATFPQDVNGTTEKWSLDYLFGIIITRDTWLHRVADLARAVDRTPRLDGGHDGRIIADVVGEWGRRHGAPFELVLTGPAGGTFRQGVGGPRIELDAVDYCRALSGRAEPTHELLNTQVPF